MNDRTPNANKIEEINEGEMQPASVTCRFTRNALSAKGGQSYQYTDRRRIQPEYEKYRMRNTLHSAGQSFSQPMLYVISTTHNRRLNPDANPPIIIFRCYSS